MGQEAQDSVNAYRYHIFVFGSIVADLIWPHASFSLLNFVKFLPGHRIRYS